MGGTEYRIYVEPRLVEITDPAYYCMTVDYAPHPIYPGDNCDNAKVIGSFPYVDQDSTCKYLDDYENTCLSPWDTGPDVIYTFSTTNWQLVTVSVDAVGNDVGSPFTGVLLSDHCPPDGNCLSMATVGSGIATIPPTLLPAGTYYIVVDNYAPNPDCIYYVLNVDGQAPCAYPQEFDAVEATEDTNDASFYQTDPDGGCANEAHGGTTNFAGITAGQAVFGVCFTYFSWDDYNYYKDFDEYLFTVETSDSARMTFVADFNALVTLADSADLCDQSSAIITRAVAACDTITIVSPCLIPGTYGIIVTPNLTPDENTGLSPSGYHLALDLEPCVLPSGRCCYGPNPQSPSCETDHQYECGRLSGIWSPNLTCATSCPPPPQCAAGSMVGQTPHLPNATAIFSTSEAGSNYRVYENFEDLTLAPTHLRFWGSRQRYDAGSGTWTPCTENPIPFHVVFLADSAGWPTAQLGSWTVSAAGTDMNFWYGSSYGDLYQYDLDLSPPCQSVLFGWISIEGEGIRTAGSSGRVPRSAIAGRCSGTELPTPSWPTIRRCASAVVPVRQQCTLLLIWTPTMLPLARPRRSGFTLKHRPRVCTTST